MIVLIELRDIQAVGTVGRSDQLRVHAKKLQD
jgi:hypothetical protein